jgi:hypothetical protein
VNSDYFLVRLERSVFSARRIPVNLHSSAPMLRIYSHLHVALLPGQSGEAWNFPKSDVPSEIGKQWAAKYFHLVFKC